MSEDAGSEEVVTLDTLHEGVDTAFEAYAEEPTDDTKSAYSEAVGKVREYKAPEPEKPQAPDKYELELGKDSPLDSSRLDEIALTAKEQGLSNEDAQAVVKVEEAAIARNAEVQQAKAESTYEEWKSEIASDSELGGEHLSETKELVTRVVEKFGNEGLTEMLELSGLDKNPGWVRFAAKVGKAMADDKFFRTKGAATGDKRTMENIFYGEVDNAN